MNIFFVNVDPTEASHDLPLEYVHKMPLETSQMLMTFIRQRDPNRVPYMNAMGFCQIAYPHHPCQLWLRESVLNFSWLVLHGIALCYLFEQEHGHEHKNKADILYARKWLNNLDKVTAKKIFTHSSILTLPLCAWGDSNAKVDIYAGLKRTYCRLSYVQDGFGKVYEYHRAKSLKAAVAGYRQYVCMKVFKPISNEDIAAKRGRLPTWRNATPPDWYNFSGNLAKFS